MLSCKALILSYLYNLGGEGGDIRYKKQMRGVSLPCVLGIALALAPLASAAPQDASQRATQARDILQQARALLRDLPERGLPGAAARLAGLQARAGDLAGALDTANSLAKPADRAEALGNISWRLAQKGETAAALSALEPVEEGQRKAAWYSTIALNLVKRGDYAGARRVMALTQDARDSQVDVLTSIARAQKKAGDAAAAGKTLNEALAAAEQEHAENPDVDISVEPEILARIAETQDALGDHRAALATLKRLRGLVEQAQPGSRDELLKLLARSQATVGEAAAAVETANQIPINAATAAPGGHSAVPVGESREFNLYLVAKFVAQRGDVRGAREVAAGIALPNWQSYAYGDIAEAQAAAGDFAGAQETIGLIPDAASRTFTLARVAMELAHLSDPAAGRMLQLATEAAGSPLGEAAQAVFPTLAVARAEAGDISGAQAIIAGIKEEHAKVWPQRNLAEAMAKAGDVRGALALAKSQSASVNKFEMLIRVATGILEASEAENKRQAASK
jgi:hypothetical protein